MTPETAAGLLEFLLPQVRDEVAITRKVLAAVPADTSGYKPSDRCMSGIELVNHIAGSDIFFLSGVLNGAFDWKPAEFKTPAEVLAHYDREVPVLIEKVAALPAAQLARDITFHVWSNPAVTYLQVQIKHSAHHRGQLSAYLRPMGAKVPSIYGPSADESIQAATTEL